jgi:hypothetical protein
VIRIAITSAAFEAIAATAARLRSLRAAAHRAGRLFHLGGA